MSKSETFHVHFECNLNFFSMNIYIKNLREFVLNIFIIAFG